MKSHQDEERATADIALTGKKLFDLVEGKSMSSRLAQVGITLTGVGGASALWYGTTWGMPAVLGAITMLLFIFLWTMARAWFRERVEYYAKKRRKEAVNAFVNKYWQAAFHVLSGNPDTVIERFQRDIETFYDP